MLKNACLIIALLIANLFVPVPTSHGQTTNWVAYNDHRPGPPPRPTVGAWGTATNVTVYDMRVGPGGNLTNFLDGQQLPVMMSVSANGDPDDFGQTGPPYPINTGTPAYNLFFGIVDVGNTNSVIGVRRSEDNFINLTFTGLNPDKRYVFRGTSARGGSYPTRWSAHTIIGADEYFEGHQDGDGPGVLTSADYPAWLMPGQAAYNSGDNRPGAVVGWDFISPGADGTFSIQSSNYIGQIPTGMAASDSYGYAISAFLLAEVEATAPTIVTQPASVTTVEENRPIRLRVEAAGTPLLYQWYKGTTEITGATGPEYVIARAALSDAGDYYVRVYNPLGSVDSSIARVNVNPDVNPPGVGTAFSYPNVDFTTQAATLNQIIIEFNEVIQEAGATQPGNYLISGAIGNPASVILTNERTVALILSTPLTEDTAYTVQVSDVLDLVGNNISAGGANNPAPFQSWMRGPGNGLLLEVFESGNGIDVPFLTNSAVFPNSPSLMTNMWAFDTRVVYPDDTKEAYGTRVRGVFIPPVSGDWVFFLRSFDRSVVYLNPNGIDAAGKQTLIAEITGNNPRDWDKLISSPVSLRAGQAYYMESLCQSDAGADVIKVAARLAGTGNPELQGASTTLDTNSLFGAAIGSPLAPKDLGGLLTIVQGPTNITVEENHIATFSVQANNPSGLPVFYRWYRNGTLIDGSFGPTYSFQVTSADDAATFNVEVSKLGSVATSGSATLSVVPDVTRPRVLEATSSYADLSRITVRFSEMVDQSMAEDLLNYEFVRALTSATLGADRMTVTLVVDPPLDLNDTYELTVYAVSDLAFQPIEPDPTTLSFVAGADAPALRIELDPTDSYYAIISWPAPSAGLTLQQTDALVSPAGSILWSPEGSTPTVVNGRNQVTVVVAGAKFYRLGP